MDTRSTETIVVGVDGTPAGWRALGYATRLAAHDRHRLLLVTAHHLPSATDPHIELVLEDSRHEAAEQALAEGVQLAHDIDPSIPVQTLSKIGSIVAPLIDASPDVAAVVLGRRQHPVARSWIGTTSTILPVVAQAACPVFVVNPEWTSDNVGDVLTYYDGSPASCSAVEYAVRHAAAHHLEMLVLERVDMPRLVDGAQDETGQDHSFATAHTELATHVAAWRERFPGVRIEYRIEPAWNVADFVLRQSREAGLLVLGHPQGGGHHHREHTIHTVLKHAACPVALVRPNPADLAVADQDAGSETAVR